jgi:hypothetical protein
MKASVAVKNKKNKSATLLNSFVLTANKSNKL